MYTLGLIFLFFIIIFYFLHVGELIGMFPLRLYMPKYKRCVQMGLKTCWTLAGTRVVYKHVDTLLPKYTA